MFLDVGKESYVPGEAVTVIFHAGCPRNNLRTEGTFLTGARPLFLGDTGALLPAGRGTTGIVVLCNDATVCS